MPIPVALPKPIWISPGTGVTTVQTTELAAIQNSKVFHSEATATSSGWELGNSLRQFRCRGRSSDDGSNVGVPQLQPGKVVQHTAQLQSGNGARLESPEANPSGTENQGFCPRTQPGTPPQTCDSKSAGEMSHKPISSLLPAPSFPNVHRLRNSVTESFGRFLHSFQVPKFLSPTGSQAVPFSPEGLSAGWPTLSPGVAVGYVAPLPLRSGLTAVRKNLFPCFSADCAERSNGWIRCSAAVKKWRPPGLFS